MYTLYTLMELAVTCEFMKAAVVRSFSVETGLFAICQLNGLYVDGLTESTAGF